MNTRSFLLLVLVLSALMAAEAQSIPVDAANSKLTVRVSRSGLFSAFGHDHEIAGPLQDGAIDTGALRVKLRFDARRMQVLDPDVSSSDRSQIQATMLSDKVLDAERYPEITFTSRRITAGSGRYTVEGELNLHGVTRALIVPVSVNNGRYVGAVNLKQTQFGIKPVKVLGGTVKVKDEVKITFDFATVKSGAAHSSQ